MKNKISTEACGNLLYAASTRAVPGSATEKGLYNASQKKYGIADAIKIIKEENTKKDKKDEPPPFHP